MKSKKRKIIIAIVAISLLITSIYILTRTTIKGLELRTAHQIKKIEVKLMKNIGDTPEDWRIKEYPVGYSKKYNEIYLRKALDYNLLYNNKGRIDTINELEGDFIKIPKYFYSNKQKEHNDTLFFVEKES